MKSYGIRMEHAGASFTNSDSADLAEIANGKRMEYTGASFANSDSADLAEIAYGNRSRNRMEYAGASFANSDSANLAEIAYGNRMEMVWKSYGIYRRKFYKFRFGGSCGNRIWKSHMEIAYVNRVWKRYAGTSSRKFQQA